MLMLLRRGGKSLETIAATPGWRLPDDAIWVELVEPTRAEELAVEAAVGADLPTREEMAEIEVSSRLYREDDATFMTAILLCGSEADPAPAPGPPRSRTTGSRS